jgi:hypothetical protein
MKKPWSDLPNAHHIDWVLASMKENPKLWEAAAYAVDLAAYVADAAWDAAWNAATWNAAKNAARSVAWYAARDAAVDAAWAAARKAAMSAAWGAARDATRDAASASLLSLVIYDDCDQYLALGYEKLKVCAVLSEKPQAILLLPMAYVREKINEQALV